MPDRLLCSVPALPEALSLDLTRTAFLVVDMQNDFGSEGGMFHRAGIDITMIRAAISPTARALSAARDAGIPIVYLKMAFLPDMSDAGASESPNHVRHAAMNFGLSVLSPGGKQGRILIRDTWNTDIIDELAPLDADTVLYKHRFSGFFETELDNVLKGMGAKYLVVTGCTTSICVESTIRDAMFRDYSCVLLKDCTAEPLGQKFPRSNHDASLLSIQALLGWVSTSDDFVEALGGPTWVANT
jgi:ureidoacrylate peracid hydrolase